MGPQTIFAALLFFIIFECGLSQKKAKEKCGEFFLPLTFNFVRRAANVPEIVGGDMTVDNEFPHMAALGYGSLQNPEWLCGGSLISNQFVLTAAHCTDMTYLGMVKLVRLGTNTLTKGNHQDIQVIQIIQHPNFKSPSSYNDIALLKLQRKVQFSKNIFPACLNTAFNMNLATNTLTALGWGKTDFAGPTSDDLLKVELRITQENQCSRSYRGSSRDKLPNGIKSATQLCAGGEVQKDTCQGDSGGPLEYKNGKFHYIVGVTAFGKACGISKTPGVYTRVSAFVSWIESIVWP